MCINCSTAASLSRRSLAPTPRDVCSPSAEEDGGKTGRVPKGCRVSEGLWQRHSRNVMLGLQLLTEQSDS